MDGSASPGFSTPAVTAALICSMSCSNCGRGPSMSMVISIDRHSYVPVDPMVHVGWTDCNSARRGVASLGTIRYQLLDDPAVAATGIDANAIVHRQHVVAIVARLDMADVANIDDDRTMDAHEHLRVEEP